MYLKGDRTTHLFSLFFLLIGLFFLSMGFWYIGNAYANDAPFVTAAVTFIFLLLFAAVSILYGFVLLKEQNFHRSEKKVPGIVNRSDFYPVIVMLIFGFAPVLFAYYSVEAIDFNKKREAAFQEIRPAFIRYIGDNGLAPKELNDLVPEYLQMVPEIFLIRDTVISFKITHYDSGLLRDSARFYYTTGGITNAEMYFDIESNLYSSVDQSH